MATDTVSKRHLTRHWTIAQKLALYSSKPAPDACWEWTGSLGTTGYGQLNVGGRPQHAMRLAWIEANGPIPSGRHVLHRCDNRKCINPAHLWLGAHADNMADKISKGRQMRGRGHPHAKLSDETVRAIRTATGTNREIGARYGIDPSTVCRIKAGLRWAHVK